MPLLRCLTPMVGMACAGGTRSLWEGPESRRDGVKGVLLQVSRANGANGYLPRRDLPGPGKSSRTVATSSPVLSFILEKKVLEEVRAEQRTQNWVGAGGGKWRGPSCHKLYHLGQVVISTNLSFLIRKVGVITSLSQVLRK